MRVVNTNYLCGHEPDPAQPSQIAILSAMNGSARSGVSGQDVLKVATTFRGGFNHCLLSFGTQDSSQQVSKDP